MPQIIFLTEPNNKKIILDLGTRSRIRPASSPRPWIPTETLKIWNEVTGQDERLDSHYAQFLQAAFDLKFKTLWKWREFCLLVKGCAYLAAAKLEIGVRSQGSGITWTEFNGGGAGFPLTGVLNADADADTIAIQAANGSDLYEYGFSSRNYGTSENPNIVGFWMVSFTKSGVRVKIRLGIDPNTNNITAQQSVAGGAWTTISGNSLLDFPLVIETYNNANYPYNAQLIMARNDATDGSPAGFGVIREDENTKYSYMSASGLFPSPPMNMYAWARITPSGQLQTTTSSINDPSQSILTWNTVGGGSATTVVNTYNFIPDPERISNASITCKSISLSGDSHKIYSLSGTFNTITIYGSKTNVSIGYFAGNITDSSGSVYGSGVYYGANCQIQLSYDPKAGNTNFTVTIYGSPATVQATGFNMSWIV